MPVRTYNINEKTCAEMVESDDDAHSSFVFRIFHQRRKHHADDDAITSMSDTTHDDLDDDDDEEKEEEEERNLQDFVAHSSDMESTESWIELIQSLAIKIDMPAWTMPWHLWNDETRSKFAKSRFETIFLPEEDEEEEENTKIYEESITKIFDRARNEIDRLHSTCA